MNDSDSEDIAVDDEVESEDKAEDDKDVAHDDLIPEEAVVLQAAPPTEPGPSMAPDLGEGLTQGTAESFSCICLEDKLLCQVTTVIESASSVSSGWLCHWLIRVTRAFSAPVVTSCHWRLWSLSSLLTCTDSSFSTKLRAQSQLLRHFS